MTTIPGSWTGGSRSGRAPTRYPFIAEEGRGPVTYVAAMVRPWRMPLLTDYFQVTPRVAFPPHRCNPTNQRVPLKRLLSTARSRTTYSSRIRRRLGFHSRGMFANVPTCQRLHSSSSPSSKERSIAMHLSLKSLLRTSESYHETNLFTVSAVLQTAENTGQILLGKFTTLFQTNKDCRLVKRGFSSLLLLVTNPTERFIPKNADYVKMLSKENRSDTTLGEGDCSTIMFILRPGCSLHLLFSLNLLRDSHKVFTPRNTTDGLAVTIDVFVIGTLGAWDTANWVTLARLGASYGFALSQVVSPRRSSGAWTYRACDGCGPVTHGRMTADGSPGDSSQNSTNEVARY
ncbi:hypothetical protein J6590_097538 [Homalodisca vitripennis]|nr:hypothetical protein J6590_097538 [Homalodisca vitripennis]